MSESFHAIPLLNGLARSLRGFAQSLMAFVGARRDASMVDADRHCYVHPPAHNHSHADIHGQYFVVTQHVDSLQSRYPLFSALTCRSSGLNWIVFCLS